QRIKTSLSKLGGLIGNKKSLSTHLIGKALRPHCLRQIRIALFSMGLLSMELADKSSWFACKPFSKWNKFKN
ncbi:MAG: hypothetical protein PHO29_13845, partial [Acetobacterium sp.]|nr:hypothetical protein [Acetobacterium sp.]